MIEVKRFINWEQAVIYKEEWNTIVTSVSQSGRGSSSVPSLFQTFEWNQTWWNIFGEPENELFLLAAFEGSLLLGVAPLMIGHRNFPIPSKVIRFIGVSNLNYASDYCSFIIKSDRNEEILTAFLNWINLFPKLWDEVEFTNLPGDSLDLPILQKRFLGRSMLHYICDAPTRFLGNDEEDRSFLNRKHLKYNFKRFKNQGELIYKQWESAEEIHSKLDNFFKQHIERRSITNDPSVFNNEKSRCFYQTLVNTLAPKGWLRLLTIDLNGKTVAYHFGFEFAGKFYFYTHSFDINQKKKPGEVLIKILIEDAINRNLKEFDFLAGSEDYKYRFTNGVRKLYQLRASHSWFRFILFKSERFLRTLARRFLIVFTKKKTK